MTTEADAQRLVDAWNGWLAEVLRIRAEAVAAERARVAEGILRAIDDDDLLYAEAGMDGEVAYVRRAAVLAIVEADHATD